MNFPTHFRDHVMPRLRQQVALQSFLIACGAASYAEGYDAVMTQARRYGAMHLPERLRVWDETLGRFRTARPRAELEDWIATSISTGILQAEPRVAEIETNNERRADADPIAYYDGLAAGSRNPEAMRWTFAAICPEYRAHLQAVRRVRR